MQDVRQGEPALIAFRVKFGATSVNRIEIKSGLQPGDNVSSAICRSMTGQPRLCCGDGFGYGSSGAQARHGAAAQAFASTAQRQQPRPC